MVTVNPFSMRKFDHQAFSCYFRRKSHIIVTERALNTPLTTLGLKPLTVFPGKPNDH